MLAAGRQLLAQGGVAAVTLRAVARALGVAPNALYSHVKSRNALLDGLLDDLLEEVASPSPGVEDPLAAARALMSSTYDTLVGAPDLVPVYLSRQGARGPNAVRLGNLLDALLERAGVDPRSVPEARRVLIVHTIGAAAFATAPAVEADESPPVPADQARRSFVQSLLWLLTGISHASAPGLDPAHALRRMEHEPR